MLNVANQQGEWPSHAYGIVMNVIDVSRKINLIPNLVFPIPPLHQPAGNACVHPPVKLGIISFSTTYRAEAAAITESTGVIVIRAPAWPLFIRPFGQHPVRTRVMAGIASGETLQIILMLRLGFPEITGRRQLGNNLTRPQA